jgi:hypothetical protein
MTKWQYDEIFYAIDKFGSSETIRVLECEILGICY